MLRRLAQRVDHASILETEPRAIPSTMLVCIHLGHVLGPKPVEGFGGPGAGLAPVPEMQELSMHGISHQAAHVFHADVERLPVGRSHERGFFSFIS